ncbi:MAG: hypothetical protein SPE59_12020 [Treponema sp.]|nr:hypothetical protein [Treponema sp.]
MNEIFEFLKSCGTYYLAAVDSEGQYKKNASAEMVFTRPSYICQSAESSIPSYVVPWNVISTCYTDGSLIKYLLN